MARTPKPVTDAELAVLKELWSRGASTIRELTESLYPGGGHASYSTVQKLLDRLEAKGHVSRERSGRYNVFTAAVEREDLIRDRLRDTANRLCEGSLTPLLSNLVSSARLSRDEVSDLRSLLDRLDGEGEG